MNKTLPSSIVAGSGVEKRPGETEQGPGDKGQGGDKRYATPLQLPVGEDNRGHVGQKSTHMQFGVCRGRISPPEPNDRESHISCLVFLFKIIIIGAR